MRALRLLLIPLFTAIGLVLTFIPGPAILFFLLAAGLLSAQSRWMARELDHAELKLRGGWSAFRSWRNRHRKGKLPQHPRASH